MVTDSFNLYLSENGKEELLRSDEDPRAIRRIIVGRSMARRLRKPGCVLRATKNGKNLRFDVLERLCLDRWFEAAELATEEFGT